MKRCYECGESKPLIDFPVSTCHSDGHTNKCNVCNESSIVKNKVKKKDYDIQYRIKNRKKLNNQQREWAIKNVGR